MKKTILYRSLALLLLFTFLLGGLLGCGKDHTTTASTTTKAVPLDEFLYVRILDVGQADGILLSYKDQFMLIDAGNYTSGDRAQYMALLRRYNVDKIDWLILTHPHGDHIGAAVDVLNTYKVKNVMLPDASYSSYAYRNTLQAILNSDANVHLVETDASQEVNTGGEGASLYRAGDEFSWEAVHFRILAPISPDDNVNNASIVLRATYGGVRFLFTGDMETMMERQLLTRFSKEELRADVLKVGHHGSYTSTNQSFLSAVSPRYAAISCGKDNEYGHPHGVILNRLSYIGVQVNRTDLEGTITYVTDGANIVVNTIKNG